MLRAIIIDDEIDAIETLEEDVRRHASQDVEIIATCSDPLLAKSIIEKYQPDLVFLDIQMPILNGFQLLESLDEINFEIIFVTAYDEYALRAFEFSATDYLLKPIERKRLQSTIEKIKLNTSDRNFETRMKVILHNLKIGSKQYPTIAIPMSDGIEFVPIEEIIYLKAESNYCHIYLINDKKLFVAKTLKHFKDMLAEFEFVRVHQSYLINVTFLRKYSKSDGGEVFLSNGTRIPVSRLHKKNIIAIVKASQ